MLEELKQQMHGKYPMGCAKELEETEAMLSFEQFDSETALSIGNLLVHQKEIYGNDIIVLVIRESDQAVIFQYIGNEKNQRNVKFAMMKRNSVLRTGHCSLWAMAEEQTNGGLDELFVDENQCLPVGGAFPVYIDGIHTATICVSGLHDGLDHSLIVDSLAEFLRKEIPEFHGCLI